MFQPDFFTQKIHPMRYIHLSQSGMVLHNGTFKATEEELCNIERVASLALAKDRYTVRFVNGEWVNIYKERE